MNRNFLLRHLSKHKAGWEQIYAFAKLKQGENLLLPLNRRYKPFDSGELSEVDYEDYADQAIPIEVDPAHLKDVWVARGTARSGQPLFWVSDNHERSNRIIFDRLKKLVAVCASRPA